MSTYEHKIGMSGTIHAPQLGLPRTKFLPPAPQVVELRSLKPKFTQENILELARLMRETK